MRGFAEIPGELRRRVAAGERVGLVLLDALGYELLMREQDHPLVAQLDLEPLRSQFPSTTAAHVSTVHFGVPVEQHGLYEWRVYEPELDTIIVPLRFRADGSEVDEDLVGRLNPAALVPGATFFQTLGAPSLVLQPREISGSVFSRATLTGASVAGFDSLSDGLAQMATALHTTDTRLVYLYWPEIDRIGHHHGPGSAQFRAEARAALDALLAAAPALAGVTVLLTADHGQVDVHPSRVDYLDLLWPELSGMLTQPRPAGSPRDAFLHVAPGQVETVIAGLAERLGDRAQVCRASELFPVIGDRLAARLADVAVLPAPGRQAWLRSAAATETWNLGQHGGRDPVETATYLARLEPA